jgi:SEC-C motif-containing protein
MHAVTCPCGSGLNYDLCCGKFHKGIHPETAEALMRSRFSAYVMHELDYLYETTYPGSRAGDLQKAIAGWAAEARFVKLEIIKTARGQSGDKTGKVEFTAFYLQNGQMHQHHEVSIFKKYKSRWYYVEGEQ